MPIADSPEIHPGENFSISPAGISSSDYQDIISGADANTPNSNCTECLLSFLLTNAPEFVPMVPNQWLYNDKPIYAIH